MKKRQTDKQILTTCAFRKHTYINSNELYYNLNYFMLEFIIRLETFRNQEIINKVYNLYQV